MQRLQYPCTCRTFGISADMHKLPRGYGYRTWADYAQRDCRLPSQYQETAIRSLAPSDVQVHIAE